MTNKRMRHLKKWIPTSIYCDNCPLWHNISDKLSLEQKRAMCNGFYENLYQEKGKEYEKCEKDCNECLDGLVSFCAYLNYKEIGQYPLGDGCKVCGIRDGYDYKGELFCLQSMMKRFLTPDAFQHFLKHCKNEYIRKYTS